MLRLSRETHTFGRILSRHTWLYVVALTLVLSGCQRTPSAGPETLTGVVTEGWSGQAASLRLEAVTFSSATVLAEAPIVADGSFTITLPSQQEVADALTPVDAEALCALFGPDPTSTLEVTPSPLEVLYAEARVYASTAPDAEPMGVLGYQVAPAEGLISVVQVYVASAGTVKGSCPSGALVFDLNLVAGWNEVLYTENASEGSITLTTGDLPDGLRWRYYSTSGEPGLPVEPPEPTPTTPTPKEISGTAEGWPGGEAVVRAESFGLETSERVDIAEGTINADGSFGLTLPVEGEALADALLIADSDLFCSGSEANITSTVEITPGPFETAFVGNYFLVYDAANNELLGAISPDYYSTPENSFIYAYAPSDVSVKGECITTYTEGSSTVSFDLEYKAGWNVIFSAESGNESGSVLSVLTGPFPTNTRWIYTEEIAPGPPPDPPPPPCEPDDPECAPPVWSFSGQR